MFRWSLCVVATLLSFSTAHADTDVWPRFRGPNGAGVGSAPGVAGTWTAANERWSVDLPGAGHGSPVVWGERLFLLATDEAAGECVLLALDAMTGKELWRQGHPVGEYHLHAANNYAATTPAVDAQRICITWATSDNYWIAAYSHAGDELWKRSIGPFESSHGFACSPSLVDGVVCVTDDQQGESSLVGLDAATGEVKWQTPRPAGKAAYASPCVVKLGGKTAIIADSMASGMTAIEVATGKEIWRLPDVFPARCVSSPVVAGDMVLGVCGGGGSGKHMIGVRLSATAPEEVFRIKKSIPYVPTPLVLDDMMVLWHDRGTVAGMDTVTGEKLWEERIGGKFFSSPVSTGDAVIAVSNDGEAICLTVDRDGCRVIARNSLGAPTQATPAIAHGRLYFRTAKRVLCIGPAETAQRSPMPAFE